MWETAFKTLATVETAYHGIMNRIWMLHLSSYSHSCLVVPKASFYDSVLTLAALETAFTAYIMTS